MSLLGKMLGSDEAIKSTIETVSKGLDSLVYTDEEKAKDASKERSEARKAIVEWMQATQGQNLTRRVLALLISLVWLMQYVGYSMLSITAIWISEPDKYIQSAELLKTGAEEMSGAVMLILGFYFAAMHLDKIITPAMEKFKGNK